MQMVMTIWLILRAYLDVPGTGTVTTAEITDSFGNKFVVITYLPVICMVFSFCNTVSSACVINLFNVYIGQFSDCDSFLRYLNLLGGHLPFFLNAITFRMLAMAWIWLYLNPQISLAFVFVMWLCNISIGYGTQACHVLPRPIKTRIQRAKSVFRKQTKEPKVREAKQEYEDSPVWLNSFLSIFVPSCFMNTLDPAAFAVHDDMDNKEKEELAKLRDRFFRREKEFQQRVIKYQVVATNTILLGGTGLAFYLVQSTQWFYSNNLLDNDKFKIGCGVVAGMGLLSYVFLAFIDVYDTLGLNRRPRAVSKTTKGKTQPKKGSTTAGVKKRKTPARKESTGFDIFLKVVVTVVFLLVAVSPLVAGCIYGSLTTRQPVFLTLRNRNETHVNVQLVMAKIIRDDSQPKASQNREVRLFRSSDSCKESDTSGILLIDWQDYETAITDNNTGCLKHSTLVVMEGKDFRSSSPLLSQIEFGGQVLSISKLDGTKTKTFIGKGKSTEGLIHSESVDELMASMEGSSMTQLNVMNCDHLAENRIHLTRPKPTNRTDDLQLYIGCDGEVKVNTILSIDCIIFGRPCPKLNTWRINQDTSPTKYEECFEEDGAEGVNPPVQCLPFKVKDDGMLPKTQKDIDKNKCWKRESSSYMAYSSSCKTNEIKTNCDEDREKTTDGKTKGRWGRWIEEKESTQKCLEAERVGDDSTAPFYKYRFCRRSKECLIIEVEKKYKEGEECTEPDKSNRYGNLEECS